MGFFDRFRRKSQDQALHVRKQVYELTSKDLEQFPIWEFALDEEGEADQDEATVRPYELLGVLDPSKGMFVVRARLTLLDGSTFCGYLTPPVQGDTTLGTLQPAITTPGGQISFWCGMITPSPSHIEQCYARLGKSSDQVFPIRYESDVKLSGGEVKGEIPGFMILEDVRTMTTKVIH